MKVKPAVRMITRASVKGDIDDKPPAETIPRRNNPLKASPPKESDQHADFVPGMIWLFSKLVASL